MLVRTPAHKPTESLRGYVLRISEENGYETPWHVLNHAGITPEAKLTTGLPVEKLAGILGRSPEDLADIANSIVTANGKREFRLLGHSLGNNLNFTPLRLVQPAVCPKCIAEHGYIDAFFDLGLAVACPHHQCEVITHCPECDAPLSWRRPGLSTCRCGASLADAPTAPVSANLADLMSIVWAVLHRTSANKLNISSQLPVDELLGMPLRTLVLKLPDLGSHYLRSTGSTHESASALELLEGAARVLSCWPTSFHDFLRRLSCVNHGTALSFGKRYEQFCLGFFKSRRWGKDFSWLRDEFVRFGAQSWSDAVLDHKMLRNAEEKVKVRKPVRCAMTAVAHTGFGVPC